MNPDRRHTFRNLKTVENVIPIQVDKNSFTETDLFLVLKLEYLTVFGGRDLIALMDCLASHAFNGRLLHAVFEVITLV